MKKALRRAALLLLAALMLLQPMAAIGEAVQEEQSDEAQYVAVATVALKVRRSPDRDSGGADSIAKDSLVYILELGEEWCKVRTAHTDGYVLTQYLDNIREYDASSATFGQSATPPEGSVVGGVMPEDESGFAQKYKAYAVRDRATIYEQADERTKRVGSVPIYKEVAVAAINGDWCYVRYNGDIGYMRTNSLFKWDRTDPYAGDIPGLVTYPLMAFVNHTTNIYSLEDNSVLKTINPGSALCVLEPDAAGRYMLPYWRETGYILEDDIAYLMPVTPWDEAEENDLLSVMTTYYAVGVSTLQYQGRNWNIYLSSSMITGSVLQPGESYNQYHVIGPYRKSTGYHKAPIMSQHALWGYGGGTCQVNTTFYMSTIQLPLLVTHRKVHAEVGIYYCPKGFDAAVGGGDINLTMENTLPYPIRYQFFLSDGVLTCCIFRAKG